METTNTNNAPVQEDKTIAIIAYITIIGYIIAIIMHGSNKTKLGSYHLKQATGLLVLAVGSWLSLIILSIIPFLGWIVLVLSPILWIAILVLLILGIMNASSGQEKPLPVIGGMAAKMFANAFN